MLYNGNGDAVWVTGTYLKGTAPCTLSVSGDGGGTIAVNDANGTQLFVQPQNPSPPPVGGVLASGQQLQEVSPHSVTFLKGSL